MLVVVARRIIVSAIVMCIGAIPVLAQDGGAVTNGTDGATAPLQPCLAVHADGTPVMPGTSFPPSKRITVAFQLDPDESARVLHSRWVALEGGGEKTIAENKLDLLGQRSGWLRLSLKEPAPPGKYRLVTMLDDEPWKAIDVEITPPIEQGAAEKVTDLIPLNENTTMSYQLVGRPGEGTKMDMPGVTPEPDGTRRATLELHIGKTEDAGTHYQGSLNGKPVGETWVKLDEKGLVTVRRKSGDKVEDVDPPAMIQPLPPSLENGVEWSRKTADGDEEELAFFGPLMLEGPEGATPGYVIFSDRQTTSGSPGASAARGRDTVERHYIPQVGLVRETRVETMSGKLTARYDLTLAPSLPYRMVKNPEMKGRLGRVVFEYPPDTKFSETRVAVFKASDKPDENADDKAAATGYGAAGFDLMPGKYEIAMNNRRVPVEVKSGHNTIPRCGVLRVHAGSETRFRVLDADQTAQLYSGYGAQDIALPVGTYFLEISGMTEEINVDDGQVVEF